MINSIGSSGASLSGIGTTHRGEAAAKPNRTGSATEDRASVSTTFSQVAGTSAPVDMDRVSALKAAIRAGTYKADPQAISRAMISGDMGSGL